MIFPDLIGALFHTVGCQFSNFILTEILNPIADEYGQTTYINGSVGCILLPDAKNENLYCHVGKFPEKGRIIF